MPVKKKGGARPPVPVTPDRHQVGRAAVEALAACQGIYQHNGRLARVVPVDLGGAEPPGLPPQYQIEPLDAAGLGMELTRCAVLCRPRESDGREECVPCQVPEWLPRGLISLAPHCGIRPLDGILPHPFLRPDGNVVLEPGYDSETRIIYAPGGRRVTIPKANSLEEAKGAADRLWQAVRDFPFKSPAHFAAWLAGLLTPLARPAFAGPAPLFLFDANRRATGKSYLVKLIGVILTGRPVPASPYSSDPEEMRKEILTIALEGTRLVFLDNVEGRIGDKYLDEALTATVWRGRKLSTNTSGRAALWATWYATGNNLEVAGDLGRRVCHIRLETSHERPEQRTDFAVPDLLGWARETRTELLIGALTILRNYCSAGRPPQEMSGWGGFEGWSSLVRAAIIWVGLPDPYKTRETLRETADQEAERMLVVLEVLAQQQQSDGAMRAADVLSLYEGEPGGLGKDWHAEFRAALEELVGKPDTVRIGQCFGKFRDRTIGGYRLEYRTTHGKIGRWRVVRVNQDPAAS
jgi:hypothetical protein